MVIDSKKEKKNCGSGSQTTGLAPFSGCDSAAEKKKQRNNRITVVIRSRYHDDQKRAEFVPVLL